MWMFLRDKRVFLNPHQRSLGAKLRIPAKLNRNITYSLMNVSENSGIPKTSQNDHF